MPVTAQGLSAQALAGLGSSGKPSPGQRARPPRGARREPGRPEPGPARTGEGRTSGVLAAATPPGQALCWPQLLLEWLADPDAPAGGDLTDTAAAGKVARG